MVIIEDYDINKVIDFYLGMVFDGSFISFIFIMYFGSIYRVYFVEIFIRSSFEIMFMV